MTAHHVIEARRPVLKTGRASRFDQPERRQSVGAANVGSRLQASLPAHDRRVAAAILVALCLHATAFIALVTLRQGATLPAQPPETALEIVALPPTPAAPAETTQPQAAPSAQPQLQPRLPPDPAVAPPPLAPPAAAPPPAEPAATNPPQPEQPPLPADPAPPHPDQPATATPPETTAATAADLAADQVSDLASTPPPVPPLPREPTQPPHRLVPARPKPLRPAPLPVRETVDPAPVAVFAPSVTGLPRPTSPSASPSAPPAAPAAAPRNASAEASFEGRIRQSVQDAVHYPAAARMMAMTGRARLELIYRAGSIADVSLIQSAGAAVLDDAARTAAKTAHYPPAPPEIGNGTLRFLIWVDFAGQ